MGAPGSTDYLFNSGDGSDEIRDDRSGENLLFFGPGIEVEDVEFSRTGRKGADLVITVGSSGDQISILGQFSQLAPVIGTLIFDDGSGLSYWDIQDIFMEDGPGDDTVLGTAGDNFFSGNAGNDLMRGFDGSDTYLLGAGDGVDTVDDGGDTGEDRLVLNFNFGDLTITSVTGGFVFLNETTGDQVTALGIEIFDFNDIYDLSANDVATLVDVGNYDNAITGTTGADTLDGTEDADLIVGLSGDDVINGYGGDDRIEGGDDDDQLYGGDGNDTILGGAGEDLLEGGDGDDILSAGDTSETPSSLRANNTLRGGAGNDILDGGWEDDVLEGGDGDDIMRGDFGNDSYRGGAGNDVMVDENDASTYYYDLGDGDDLIFDDGSTSTTDAIEFGAGISQSDLTFSFVIVDPRPYTDYYAFDEPQSAIRAELAQGGSITFAGNPSDSVGSIDVLRFDDGSTLSRAAIEAMARAPTAADQLIVPRTQSSDDIIEGGGGDDTLYGNYGDQTYLFNAGDGHDTIVAPEFNSSGLNIVQFGPDVASGDITISRAGEFDEDLVITLDSGESITVSGQYGLELNPYSSDPLVYRNYIDRIVFESEPGVVIDASEMLLATQTATGGDDLQIGSDQADALAASAGADELRGGRSGDDYAFGIGSGADIIVETNRGLTYIPYPDDGPELDIALLRETDTLTFGAGVTVSDLVLTATGSSLSDLLIEIQGTGDSILIRDQLAASGNWGSIIDQYSDEGPHVVTAEEWEYDYADYFGEEFLFHAGIERFVFDDGTTLTWQEFADLVTNRDDEGDNTIATDDLGGVLDGGAGTDRLEGGAGDDTYVLNLGSFNDTASDAGGYDEVAFGAGISPELIAFSRVGENGDDLLIEIGGEERNSLLIEGQFAGDGRTLEYFYTDDGAEFSSQAVEKLLLAQSITNGDDAVLGYEGDDVIDARDGDDRIESRGGNDLIDGGAGRDTAVFRGPRSNYDVVVDGDWIIVSDNVGNEGVNRIRNVETLEFLGGEGGDGAATEVIVANQAPSAGALAFDAREDTPLILRASVLIAAAADPDGGSLSLSSAAAISGGSVEIDDQGRVIFTPDAEFTGSASFSYTVEDADGAEASASVTVDVAPVNDAPELAIPLADQSFDEDTAVLFTINSGAFSDVDLDNLTLSALLSDGSDLPDWLTFDAETGTFSGTPPADFNGVLEIEVTASDSEFSASDVFDLTISPVNDAPIVAAPLDDYAADANELFEFVVPQAAFSDVDGDTLTYTATLADGSALPDWLLFSEEFGAFSGLAPTGVNGDFAIRVTATDGIEAVSDDFTLTITGNAAPTDINLSNASIDENSEGGAVVGVLSATDPEPGDTFTYSILTEDSPFEIDGDQLVVRDGAIIDFETQPAIDVTIEVRDAAGNPYEELFSISVNDVNEAPTDIDLSDYAVDENSAAGTVVASLSAVDPDAGETFTYAIKPESRPLDEALLENAGEPIAVAYNGSDPGFLFTGLSLASAGRVYDSEDDAVYSVWRIRNSAESAQTVTLNGLLNGFSKTLTVEANTDTYVLSTYANGLATHALLLGLLPVGLSLIASTSAFDNNTLVDLPNANFDIDGNNLVVADGAALDHELTPSQSVIIEVTDSAGYTYEEEITIDIDDVGGAAAPVVLDLDGDGVELVSAGAGGVWFDFDADGVRERGGWVAADDGFLALDRNANGRIDDVSEISFIDDLPGAGSDLEGLAAFDSNGDGVLDAADARFADFQVWQDINGNGRSEAFELTGLAERGIDSLGPVGQAPETPAPASLTENMVLGTGTVAWTDGSVTSLADVALSYDPEDNSGNLPTALDLLQARFAKGIDIRPMHGVERAHDVAVLEDAAFDFRPFLTSRHGPRPDLLDHFPSISQFDAPVSGPHEISADIDTELPLGQILHDRFELSSNMPHKYVDHDFFELV